MPSENGHTGNKYIGSADRYPGVSESVGEEEYQEAVSMAEAVVSWAERIVKQ